MITDVRKSSRKLRVILSDFREKKIVNIEFHENPSSGRRVVPTRTDTTKPIFKKTHTHYRPDVPRRFQEVKVPRLRDNGPGWW